MSRNLKTVTKTMFEPGSYSSHYTRVTEDRVDVCLPAPDGPFDVLRFKIGGGGRDELIVTVHFAGPAEICPPAHGEAGGSEHAIATDPA